MAVYECILKPGYFNGKSGRFIGGARITVTPKPGCPCDRSAIERTMVEQYGDDAKGCGCHGEWIIRKL